MQMGVMMELLAPGMRARRGTKLGTEMLRVSGDILEGPRHSTKEEPVEQARVLERERLRVMREGEDDMAVGSSRGSRVPGGEPRGLRGTVPLGAAAMPAGV